MATSLTPELSLENPNLYKDRLLQVLGKSSVSGTVALEKAGIDMAAMTFNHKGYRSMAYNNGYIHLGTALMDQAMKSHLMFQEEDFGPEDEVAYRLLHEVAHTSREVASQMPQGIALTRLVRRHRTGLRIGRGLTALGSLEHFQNIHSKHREDETELLAMHYWDPKYLEAYATYLSDPSRTEARDERGIVTLDQTDDFSKIVSSAAEAAIA